MVYTKRIACMAAAACLLTAGGAAAQAAGPLDGEPRFFFSVNGIYQGGAQDLHTAVSFGLYDEQGNFDVRRRVSGGGALDVGAAYRVRGSLAAGIGVTRFADTANGSIAGSVPHPLFFNQFRPFSFDAPDLRHRERAVHLQAIWWVPVTNEWDVSLVAGPSVFTVTQTGVADVQFSEVGAPFTAIDASLAGRTDHSRSAVGFHIGADSAYMFTPNLGAGVTLRFSRASVNMPAAGGSVSVTAGGMQIGAGVRLRFRGLWP